MAGSPTISDVLDAMRELHGDVKVALDRTGKHETHITEIRNKVSTVEMDVSSLKTRAAVYGTVAATAVAAVVEWGRGLFDVGHHNP